MSLLMFGTFFGADFSKKNLLNFRKEYVEVKFYLIKTFKYRVYERRVRIEVF